MDHSVGAARSAGDDILLFTTLAETGLRNGADVISDFRGRRQDRRPSLRAGRAGHRNGRRFDANATNQIRYSFGGTDTIVHIDTDTDRGSEAETGLFGQHELNADVLILIASSVRRAGMTSDLADREKPRRRGKVLDRTTVERE